MYLGIDLGTSGIKLVLLRDDHQVVGVAQSALTVTSPQSLWSEQDPEAWWQALQTAVAQLRAQCPTEWAAVRAIGLSGQMHGAVLLDANHAVLRPAILWNDGRSAAQCDMLETREPRARAITGNLAMPGFTAPKLLWVAQHEPAVFAATRMVLLPKDWLRWKLTEELVSEMSDASGTLWLDVANRCWSEPMLHATGLNLSHMPRLVEGTEVSGALRSDVAREWGLRTMVAVAGGGGDNAASAVGIGAVQAGQGFVSLGTSGVLFLVTGQFCAAPERAVHAFAHAMQQRWHQMAVMLNAASALRWVTQLTGRADEATLLQEVAALSDAARSAAPLFLPYLSGERTPHNNPHAAALFAGLRAHHGAAALGYAVIEGVAFGLMDGLAAMQSAAKSAAEPSLPLILVGGGARSDLWAQLLASGLGRTLQRDAHAPIAAALGAARLAWLADGGEEAMVCANPALAAAQFAPNSDEAARLAPRYAQFKQLYSASIVPNAFAM